MGKVPKISKPRKVCTPGSYPEEARKRSSTSSQKGKKRKLGGGGSNNSSASKVKMTSSRGKGRPTKKRKGTARKDNYRLGANTVQYLPAVPCIIQYGTHQTDTVPVPT